MHFQHAAQLRVSSMTTHAVMGCVTHIPLSRMTSHASRCYVTAVTDFSRLLLHFYRAILPVRCKNVQEAYCSSLHCIGDVSSVYGNVSYLVCFDRYFYYNAVALSSRTNAVDCFIKFGNQAISDAAGEESLYGCER